MEVLKILKWGNSSGMRIPKSIMKTMNLHENDQVQMEVEMVNGRRRLVIQSENEAKDPTIEELFENFVKHHNSIKKIMLSNELKEYT